MIISQRTFIANIQPPGFSIVFAKFFRIWAVRPQDWGEGRSAHGQVKVIINI